MWGGKSMKQKRLPPRCVSLLLCFALLHCTSNDPAGPPGDSTGDGNDTNPAIQRDIPWPTLADTPWPMYRHDPQGTGRSPFAGPTAQPSVQWMFPVGSKIFSSPVIGTTGRIYFGCDDKYIYGVDASGALHWRINATRPNISSPLVLADSTIVFGTGAGKLYKIAADGSVRWVFDVGQEIFSSLTIDLAGNLYFVTTDNHLNSVEIRDVFDGTQAFMRWKVQAEPDWIDVLTVFLTPVFSPDGQTIYVGGKHLYALNLDGTLKWRFETAARINRDPLVDSAGNIYFSVYLIEQRRWSFCSIDADGNLRWQRTFDTTLHPTIASPTIDRQGNLYTVVQDTLYSFSNSGELNWTLLLDHPVLGALSCDNNDNIFIGSTDFEPAVLFSVSADGVINWRLEIVRSIDVSIAIDADGGLYFGTSTGFPVPQSTGRGLFYVK